MNVLGKSVRKFISSGLFSCFVVVINKSLNISNAFNYSIYTQLVSDKKYHVVTCCVTLIMHTLKSLLEILFHVKFSIKKITGNSIKLSQSLRCGGIIRIICSEHLVSVWSKRFQRHLFLVKNICNALTHIMHKGNKRTIHNIIFIDDIKHRHQIEVVHFMSKCFGCCLKSVMEE